MTPDGQCETMGELMQFIEEHASTIFIRAHGPDGHMVTMRLSDAPAPDVLAYAFRWLRAGRQPVRVVTPPDEETPT